MPPPSTRRRCAGPLIVEHEPARLAERIADILSAGFDGAYLHHVGRDQAPFLAMAGTELLPALRHLLPTEGMPA